MQGIKKCPLLITLFCDADKRFRLLQLFGERNRQMLGPTIEKVGDSVQVGIKKSASAATDADQGK